MKQKNLMWESKKILVIGLAGIIGVIVAFCAVIAIFMGIGYGIFNYLIPSIKPFFIYLDSFYSGAPFMIGMIFGLFFVSNYTLYKAMPKVLKRDHNDLHSKNKNTKDSAQFSIFMNESALFIWGVISIFAIKYEGNLDPSMAGIGWFILIAQLIFITVLAVMAFKKSKKKRGKKNEVKHNKKSRKTVHRRQSKTNVKKSNTKIHSKRRL